MLRVARAFRVSQAYRTLHTSSRLTSKTIKSVSFGFREVPEAEKEGLVHSVFRSVAPAYDVMNDLMSGGLHRLWKDQLVAMLRPALGCRHLDVAGGTGDISLRVVAALRQAERQALTPAPCPSHVTVFDINGEMLKVGQQRAKQQGVPASELSWVEGNAESLPFEDNSLDSYTIAFGLRNCTHMDRVLREARRVLVPGGRFLCLEFSHVSTPGLRQAYEAYSFSVIPAMGHFISGDRDSYQYLVESIRKFPTQEELANMMREAGFSCVEYTNLTYGVVCIHSGFKLPS